METRVYEHMWFTHDRPAPATSHFTVYNVLSLHAISLNSNPLQVVLRAPSDPGGVGMGRGWVGVSLEGVKRLIRAHTPGSWQRVSSHAGLHLDMVT